MAVAVALVRGMVVVAITTRVAWTKTSRRLPLVVIIGVITITFIIKKKSARSVTVNNMRRAIWGII